MSDNEKKKLMGKEEILGVNDLEYRKIKVWGGTIRLRSWTGKERDRFETVVSSQSKGSGTNIKLDTRNIRALALSMSIVDGEGNLIFSKDDLDALNKKSSKEMIKLFDIIQEMNGLGDEDIEELRKN